LFNIIILTQANIFQWQKLTSKNQTMNDCGRSDRDQISCTMAVFDWDVWKISTKNSVRTVYGYKWNFYEYKNMSKPINNTL